MLNQFIKHQKLLKQLTIASLCLSILAACATSPKENNDGSLSASQRLSRIKNTGTSKEPVKEQSESEGAQSDQEEGLYTPEEIAEQSTKETKAKEAKTQETYDFSSSEYSLPKAKKRVRPQPEVSKELRDAYKDALKTMNKGLKDKEFDQALTEFKNIEAQYPEFSGPSTNIGMIYMHQEKFAEAETAFKKALEINNENEYAYNNLGLAYRELGKFPEAKQSYQSAIELEPKYAEAHYNLGVLAELYLQDLELAIQSFEHYKLANRKKDEEVDTWLIDLRNRQQALKQIAAQETQAPPQSAPVNEAPKEEEAQKAEPESDTSDESEPESDELDSPEAESNSEEEDTSVESEEEPEESTEDLENP